MINGITEKEEQIIKNILKNYPYEFFYYGSRVKGDYTKSSDLDILLKSDIEVLQNVIEEIENKFNESFIPYVVNISNKQTMSESFYKLIEKDLIKIEV